MSDHHERQERAFHTATRTKIPTTTNNNNTNNNNTSNTSNTNNKVLFVQRHDDRVNVRAVTTNDRTVTMETDDRTVGTTTDDEHEHHC
jgi:hypothetical protein